ncbi:hypothetical protein HK097_003962, partial [Rhizophlyctis rosea]
DAFGSSSGAGGAQGPTKDDAEEVKTIVGMGYSREQALNALQLNDFNLEKAVNYLMDAK